MKGIWGEFRRSWREFRRFWKLWVLFTISYYIPWLVAVWVLPFYGIPEEISLMVMVGGFSLAFLVAIVGYYSGWGLLKCQFCGRPLERRVEGSVLAYYCPVHGNVRGIIKEG